MKDSLTNLDAVLGIKTEPEMVATSIEPPSGSSADQSLNHDIIRDDQTLIRDAKMTDSLTNLDAVLGIITEPKKVATSIEPPSGSSAEENTSVPVSTKLGRNSQVFRALVEEKPVRTPASSKRENGISSGKSSNSMWEKWDIPWGGFVLLTVRVHFKSF
jgi:hypothetical protein